MSEGGGQNKTTDLRRAGYDMDGVERNILAQQSARTDVPAGVDLSEGNLSRIFAAIKNDNVDFYEDFLFDLYTGNALIYASLADVDSLTDADMSTTLPEVARYYAKEPRDPLTHKKLDNSLFTTDGMRSVRFSEKDELHPGDRVRHEDDNEIYRVTGLVGTKPGTLYTDKLILNMQGRPVISRKEKDYRDFSVDKYVPSSAAGGAGDAAGGAAGGPLRSSKRSRRNNSKNNSKNNRRKTRRNNRRNISRRRRF